MHSGAKLLRKTLTGTERSSEHKARKSKSLVRPDKKVRQIEHNFKIIISLNVVKFFLDIGWYTTCRDDETLYSYCSA